MIGSRSDWNAALALALLAPPAAGFGLLRPDRAIERSTPEASELAPTATPHPRSQPRPRPSIGPSQLAIVRSAARGFASQYAAYVTGRLNAREIADAAPELIRELRRHAPRVTPGQQRRRPTLRRVAVAPGAATLHAVATLQEAGAPVYQLAFYLERRDARWQLTRLSDA